MKKTYLIILLVALSASSIAQIKSGTKIKKMPLDIEEPNGSGIYEDGKTTKMDWIVYSDRDNNKTFDKPEAGAKDWATVQFMDKFYVIDDEKEFLHIVMYDYKMIEVSSKSQSILKKEAIDMGWIKKTNLLLWSSGLYNEKKFKIKALPAIRDEQVILNPEKYIKKGGNLILYNTPDFDKQNDQQVRMFQFLYVYKKIDTKYLVGKTDKISSNTAQSNILGWVDEKIVQIWGDRVCLEPNWDIQAVEERKKENISAALLLNAPAALNYFKTGKINDKVWDDDPYEKRKETQWKRFPILGTKDDIIETGVLGDIVNQKGQPVVNLDEQANANAAYNDKVIEMRTINMVFVIDGGKGMSEYTPSLMAAIDKIKNQNNNSDIKSDINYGAVIYRGYGDEMCGGDLSIAKSNLSKDINVILGFLEREINIKSCSDKKNSNAVRKGIYKGLQMISDNVKKEQSNFLILIGGAGDNSAEKDSKYSTDKLAKMMADVQAHFMVFQVNNGSAAEFRSFVDQNRKLFLKAGNNMNLAIEQDKKLGTSKMLDPVWSKVINNKIYRIDYPRTCATLGTIIFPDYGKVMETTIFTTEMDTMLDLILTIIENKIQGLSARFDGIGDKDMTNLDPSILILLHSMSETIPPEVLKEYMNHNYQFFIKAYTSTGCVQLKEPIYKRVLFINEDEFEDLKNRLTLLSIDESDGDEQRKKLYDAFSQILVTYLGDKEAKKAIKNMSPEEILALVTGLKSKNLIFSKYKLNDILKKEKVSRDELNEMVEYLSKKGEFLRDIKFDKQYLFNQYRMNYYWIPEDILP